MMNVELFQQKLDQLMKADSHVLEVFSEQELNSLDGEQKVELVEFLELEPLLAESCRGKGSFSAEVMKSFEIQQDQQSSENFTKAVIAKQGVANNVVQFTKWMPWAVAACFATVVAVQSWPKSGDEEELAGSTEVSPKTDDRATLNNAPAIIVASHDLNFGANTKPNGVLLEKGNYSIDRGIVHLKFINGVDMAIQAPAQFAIDDQWNVKLNQGITRALVPESGHGFTIHTPEMKVVDLGTEFGVSVSPEQKESEVRVFEGEVRVERGQEKTPLHTDDTLRVHRETGKIATEVSPKKFPSLESVSYQAWRAWASKMKTDKDLFVYLPFDQSNRTKLEAYGSAKDRIKVSGTHMVSGRWPQKRALLFDGEKDYIEFDLGQDVKDLTVSMWMKFDRVDTPLTALVNTNEWPDGGWHLQVIRSTAQLGSGIKNLSNIESTKTIQSGVWTHVVAVINQEKGIHKLYLNGKLSSHSDPFIGNFNPGVVRVGNWKKIEGYKDSPERGFKGKLGELMILKRSLNQKEVAEITATTRPSFLWKP